MRARTYDPETGRFLTPDSAEPNPQFAESYNPYAFANSNPHLYSDPAGLFTVTEINVSINISDGLEGFKTAVLQNARQYAADQIKEATVNLLVDQLKHYLPTFGDYGVGKFIRRYGTEFSGEVFQDTVNDVLQELVPFPDGVWIEPTINTNGEVLRSNLLDFSPEAVAAAAASTSQNTVPDYLINPKNPLKNPTSTTWLVGDISLTANRPYKKYKDPGKQINQWNAITNHAEEFGIRISAFFTFYKGETEKVAKGLQSLIAKEAFQDGTFVFIISLIDR